jgi:hypothetical protein
MGDTFVISDVHGHLDDLRAVLAQAGLVHDDRWVGGDASLWVLGDLVDRGPDGIGVVRLVRSLIAQAPEQVHMLMGNHESLMLGEKLFPGTRFDDIWHFNGGIASDQAGLDDDDVAWLRGLPAMALVEDHLLMHSDTAHYLSWGSSVDEVNSTLAAVLAGDDVDEHFEVFAALTDRFDFTGPGGEAVARQMLDTFGGAAIVHGHSIIGSLVNRPSHEVTAPLRYAGDLVTAIDGGRYDGGPLLLVQI